jgi:hypothetical protein
MVRLTVALAYRINSFFNLLTFLVNRFVVAAWMLQWLLIHKDLVPPFLFRSWSLCIVLMTLINFLLLFQILQSDYMRSESVMIKTESNGNVATSTNLPEIAKEK